MRPALIVFLTIFSLSLLSNTRVVPAVVQPVHAPARHAPRPEKKPENAPYQKLVYDSQKNEWSLSARLIQIKDVTFFGQPAQVGQAEYRT